MGKRKRRTRSMFDPARADPIWRHYPVPPPPTTPVLKLSQAEVDSLPEAMQVPAQGGIAFDSLQIRFGQDVLLRQDLAAIFLIRDNQGKRPVFFSWSDGGYPDQTLGLSSYLVSHGFVRKLMPTPVKPAPPTVVLSQGLGYVDVPRTKTLLWDVYHWQTATRRRPFGWVDPRPDPSCSSTRWCTAGPPACSRRSNCCSGPGSRRPKIAATIGCEFCFCSSPTALPSPT